MSESCQRIYLNQIISWLNKYNKKQFKVINYNSKKNENFYLNNNKLKSKIKVKNSLFELKKDCLDLSKKLFS